jgi:hypothetical protein
MAEPKDIALDHFEKVILALAAAALIIVGMGTVGAPEELKKTTDLNKKAVKVKNYMKGAKPEAAPVEDRLAVLSKNLDTERLAKGRALPNWTMYRRPTVLASYKRKEKRARVVHMPPTAVKGNGDTRGKIVLTWAHTQGNEFVIVENYLVQRKEGKEGEWKTISTLKGEDTRHEDAALASRKTYFYRVVSQGQIDHESGTVRKQKLLLDASEAEQASIEVGPFTTARDVYIVPSNVTPVTQAMLIKDSKAKARAYVYIYKWHAGAGEFIKKGFPVEQDKPIGKAGVKVRVGGKRMELDFSTGATLVDCREEMRPGKFGQETKVGIIKIRWKSGSEEEATTLDPKPSKE